MRTSAALLFLLSVMPLLALDEQDQQPVTGWLRSHAIPLKTVSPGSPTADLQPLKKIVGPARIVALGEATHGTREFFQLKHRLIEFLVTEMGFNTIALEAGMPEAQRLNAYLQTGQGDPAQLVRGLGFWAWDTQEVLDAVQWMRRYNQSGKGHLQFVGFDVQHPEMAIGNLRAFLSKEDPGYLDQLPSETSGTATAWNDVIQHLETKRTQYKAKPAEMDWLIQNARLVRQSLQAKSKEVSRDRSMADNIKWVTEHNPEARLVIWTHNGHASMKNIRGYDPMGGYLREMYGNQAVLIGSAFYEGSFQTMTPQGMHNFTVPPTPAGSMDAVFAAVGLPLFAVDMRTAPKEGPVASWLHSPQKMRSAGGTYAENAPLATIAPAECFDAMLFVKDSTIARKNP